MKFQQITTVSFALFMVFSLVQADYEYKVITYTGNGDNSQTDHPVFINLHGTKGSSLYMRLDNDVNKDYFEKGSMDEFKLSIGNDLGYINRIQLRKDGNNGWLCKQVIILSPEGGSCFEVNRFLNNIHGHNSTVDINKAV